jgi:hypothetical protein
MKKDETKLKNLDVDRRNIFTQFTAEVKNQKC